MAGQQEQPMQRKATVKDPGLPSRALSMGLVPDFPFPTHLLSAVYFCLDSQAGWVKIFSHLSPSSPTEHAAAAGPQLPVFLHPAQDERGHGTVRALTPRLPAPRAAGSRRSGCEGRKVPRASLGPLPSWAFLTCAPSQVARRHQAWETAPGPRLHLGGQPAEPPDGPCGHIVLNTMVFQK